MTTRKTAAQMAEIEEQYALSARVMNILIQRWEGAWPEKRKKLIKANGSEWVREKFPLTFATPKTAIMIQAGI